MGLKEKVQFTDKLPQLLGYLPVQVDSVVIVRLSGRGREKKKRRNPIPPRLQSVFQAYSLSSFPPCPFYLFHPNVDSLVKQWGPFSTPLTGLSFLRLVLRTRCRIFSLTAFSIYLKASNMDHVQMFKHQSFFISIQNEAQAN